MGGRKARAAVTFRAFMPDLIADLKPVVDASGGASCLYFIDKETFDIAYTIGLSAGGGVGQNVFDALAADDGAEPVSGIGDEAIWYGGGLVVRKGDRVLSTGAPTTDETDEATYRGILEDLTRTALDRL